MNLEQVANSLPNGLHDAEIKAIQIDYVDRRVTMDLAAWVGDMGEVFAPREAYRDATLTLEGMQFVVMEPPEPSHKFAEGDSLWIDVTHDHKHLRVPAIMKLQEGFFVSGFFVQEWGSYIVVAAREARLDWKGEMVDRSLLKPKRR